MSIGKTIRAYIIEEYGTQSKAARVWGVSTAMVSQVVMDKIPPPKWMLNELGLEKRVVYVAKGEQ